MREKKFSKKMVQQLQDIYYYYNVGGFKCWVGIYFSHLCSLGFTICFSTWLLIGFNWYNLFTCSSEIECKDISLIRYPQPFQNVFDTFILVYFIVFSLYWLWNFYYFFLIIRRALWTFYFYKDKLKSETQREGKEDLSWVNWSKISEALIQRQLLTYLNLNSTSSETIKMKIMEKENIWIKIIQSDVLELFHSYQDNKKEEETKPLVLYSPWWSWNIYGSITEWNLKMILFSFFNSTSKTSSSSPSSLQKQFRLFALLNLLFLPFLFLFLFIYYILKYTEGGKTNSHNNNNTNKKIENKTPNTTLFTSQEWTLLSKYFLRQVNELPHEFHYRLSVQLQPLVINYLQTQITTVLNILAQLITYICGAFIAILLLLTLIDSSLLLNHYVGNRSLLWYLAFFSTLLTVIRSYLPLNDPEVSNVVYSEQKLEQLRELFSLSHYKNLYSSSTLHSNLLSFEKDLSFMFCNRFYSLLSEIFSLFMLPYLLGIYYGNNLERIERIIQYFEQQEKEEEEENNFSSKPPLLLPTHKETTPLKDALRFVTSSHYNNNSTFLSFSTYEHQQEEEEKQKKQPFISSTSSYQNDYLEDNPNITESLLQ